MAANSVRRAHDRADPMHFLEYEMLEVRRCTSAVVPLGVSTDQRLLAHLDE